MTVVDTSTFVVFNSLSYNNPTAFRNRKLIAKIDEQIQITLAALLLSKGGLQMTKATKRKLKLLGLLNVGGQQA